MTILKSLITASHNEEQDEFISVYKDMIETMKKKDKDALDIKRIGRLNALIDNKWKDFDNKKQQDMVRLLVKHELLPERFEWSADIFNASFDKISLL